MSDKYDIKINPPRPSDEEINEHKDFNGLLKQAEQIHKPWWVLHNVNKDPKLVRVLVLIMIVLMTLYFAFVDHKKEGEEDPASKSNQEQPKSTPDQLE